MASAWLTVTTTDSEIAHKGNSARLEELLKILKCEGAGEDSFTCRC